MFSIYETARNHALYFGDGPQYADLIALRIEHLLLDFLDNLRGGQTPDNVLEAWLIKMHQDVDHRDQSVSWGAHYLRLTWRTINSLRMIGPDFERLAESFEKRLPIYEVRHPEWRP